MEKTEARSQKSEGLIINYIYDRQGYAHGFKAICGKCGKRLRHARNCNRGGLAYAEAGAREDYEKHITKCKTNHGSESARQGGGPADSKAID